LAEKSLAKVTKKLPGADPGTVVRGAPLVVVGVLAVLSTNTKDTSASTPA